MKMGNPSWQSASCGGLGLRIMKNEMEKKIGSQTETTATIQGLGSRTQKMESQIEKRTENDIACVVGGREGGGSRHNVL